MVEATGRHMCDRVVRGRPQDIWKGGGVLPPLDPELAVDDRALAALGRTRALGLHFLGHFLSVAAIENGDGESVLVLDPPRPPRAPGDGSAGSPTELAVLADLSCGSAIRSVLAPDIRLGTTALAVDHLRPPAPGVLRGRARVSWSDAKSLEGHARCDVVDADETLIATASGWFVALPAPAGHSLPPVPWEAPADAVPGLAEADLLDHEHATLAAVRRGVRLAGERRTGVVTQLVVPDLLPDPDGDEVAWELPVGPALGNRVRQMQGGALYGAAAAAATVALGPDWTVAAGAVQFLRPVDAPYVRVSARLVRRGRRVGFTEVRVTGSGRLALVGQFTHRPREHPAG